MFSIRPTLFSYQSIRLHLLQTIRDHRITNLKQWTPPLYYPQDIPDIEHNIFQCKQTLLEGNPTIERPYYRYPLNIKDRKCRTKLPEWYLLYWGPNDKTNMHSHPPGGCFWWLIEGKLTELKPNNVINIINTNPNGVAIPNFAGSTHDYHQIMNSNEDSISLHVYWNTISKNQDHNL